MQLVLLPHHRREQALARIETQMRTAAGPQPTDDAEGLIELCMIGLRMMIHNIERCACEARG